MGEQLRRNSIILSLIIGICFLVATGTSLATNESISNPYQSATVIKNGSIVSLSTASPDQIVPSNTSNEQRVVGISISSQQVLLALNDASNTTQVISNGIADTLVSTLNGPISIGTQIAVTPLNGIGASALQGSRVIGIAEANFNSSTPGSVVENIHDTKGNLHKIYVGYIPLLVSVPSPTNNTSTNGFLSSLRTFFSDIAGHTISLSALIIICIIAILAFVSIIVLIYSAISGGLISVGRNPLAKTSIFAALGQIFVMVLLIAAASVIIIYFVLH